MSGDKKESRGSGHELELRQQAEDAFVAALRDAGAYHPRHHRLYVLVNPDHLPHRVHWSVTMYDSDGRRTHWENDVGAERFDLARIAQLIAAREPALGSTL